MVENLDIEVECILGEQVEKDLMNMIHSKNWEYSVKEIIEFLEDKGYEHVGIIVEKTMYDNVLSVNTVDDDVAYG